MFIVPVYITTLVESPVGLQLADTQHTTQNLDVSAYGTGYGTIIYLRSSRVEDAWCNYSDFCA
jgi:hypothetical protein